MSSDSKHRLILKLAAKQTDNNSNNNWYVKPQNIDKNSDSSTFTSLDSDHDEEASKPSILNSDDTDADPDFHASNEPSSSDSTNEISKSANKIAESANMIGKRKISFPSSVENKSRKRKKNVQQWRKNVSKLLRNSGRNYESVMISKNDDGTIEKTLITREGRKMLPPCNDKCRLSCSNKFTEEARQNIFDEFWKMADLQRQRDFIAANMTTVKPKYRYQREGSRRRLNCSFHLAHNEEKIRVCKQFFIATLGISGRTVRTVEEKRINGGQSGFISTDLRGKHGNHASVSTSIKDGIRKHILSIPKIESHYCRASTSKEYIAADRSISDLYRDYKKLCEDENVEFGNYLMYYSIFNQEFNLSFFSPKKDQCELCSKFKNSSDEEKKELVKQYENHLNEKDLSRIEKENDKNSDSIVAIYDLQAVLPCPQGDVSSFYYVSKLNVFNFTIFELQTTDVDCYVWHEGQANRGSNEIASCVWRYLKTLNERFSKSCVGDRSKELIFYSDNCAGQNKNKTIISMYSTAILALKSIKSITHKFLIAGHSQNEGDSVHSNIEKQIKKARKAAPIYVPDHYVSIIRSAKKTGKPYCVHELCYEDFYDFGNSYVELNKRSTSGEPFKISNVKVLKFSHEKPSEILYKTSFADQDFKTVLLTCQHKNTRKRSSDNHEQQLKKAYCVKTGIPDNKKKGLLQLIERKIVPGYYKDFYANL